jgi:hypothetical protein
MNLYVNKYIVGNMIVCIFFVFCWANEQPPFSVTPIRLGEGLLGIGSLGRYFFQRTFSG